MDALVARGYDYDVNRSRDPNSQAERYGSVVLFGRDDCESVCIATQARPRS